MPQRGVYKKPKRIKVTKEKNGLTRLTINYVETLLKPDEVAKLKKELSAAY